MYKLTYPIIFTCILIADRISKMLALVFLQHQDMKVFSGLNLSLTWNRGISWGMLSSQSVIGYSILTTVIGLIIVAFSLYTFYEFRKGNSIIFEVLVLSGAISNIIDRIIYGGVIDFIDCYFHLWHWPTFNIADVCIIIGIIGIAKGISSCK